jgi:hypothetical protein
LRCLLNVLPLKLALSAKCFIYRVRHWALFIINHLHINLPPIFVLTGSAVRAFEREGLEGFFSILGFRVSPAGMLNMPESAGMDCVWYINLL